MRIRTILLAAAIAAGAALPAAASAQRYGYGDGYHGQPRYGYQGGYQDRGFNDRFDRHDRRRWEQRRRWEEKQRRRAWRHHRFADGYRDYGYRY